MLRLKDDLLLALDKAAFFRHAGARLKRRAIVPDPWQEDLLWKDPRRALLNCSRQSGKSTVVAGIALHKVLYQPESLVLILGPSERQAKEIFAKVSRFYGALGAR